MKNLFKLFQKPRYAVVENGIVIKKFKNEKEAMNFCALMYESNFKKKFIYQVIKLS